MNQKKLNPFDKSVTRVCYNYLVGQRLPSKKVWQAEKIDLMIETRQSPEKVKILMTVKSR